MTEKKAIVITLANVSGRDALPLLDGLLHQLPRKSKSLVIETPCVGMPRLLTTQLKTKEQILSVTKEKTVDQFLIDYDRENAKPLSAYTVSNRDVEYLGMFPLGIPESPVYLKLSSNRALIDLPGFLHHEYGHMYDYMIFVTQGKLTHAATHLAMRNADAVVLYSHDLMDHLGNYPAYGRMLSHFGFSKERVFMYQGDPLARTEDTKLYRQPAELFKAVLSVTPTSRGDHFTSFTSYQTREGQSEVIGMIDPLQFLNYQYKPDLSSQKISATEQEKLKQLTDKIRQDLSRNHLQDYAESLQSEEGRSRIRYIIADIIQDLTTYELSLSRDQVIRWVQREITELGPMQDLLDEDKIMSIEMNGPSEVNVERDGIRQHEKGMDLKTEAAYNLFINKLLAPLGKSLTANNSIVDADFGDFRINIIADRKTKEGLSTRYPLVSIRKLAKDAFTPEQFVAYGNMSREMVAVIGFLLNCKISASIAGSTNSGKTTSLTSLPLHLPTNTRIMTVEDVSELRLAMKKSFANYTDIASLVTKPGVGLDQLIEASLRQNLDQLIIGEVRKPPEGVQALTAMYIGTPTLYSIHANSAKDALTRLWILNANTEASKFQIGNALQISMFQERLPNGKRVMTEFDEVIGFKGSEPITNPIFRYDYEREEHIRVGNFISPNLHTLVRRARKDIKEIQSNQLESYGMPTGIVV